MTAKSNRANRKKNGRFAPQPRRKIAEKRRKKNSESCTTINQKPIS
jgi:hypothetical protein